MEADGPIDPAEIESWERDLEELDEAGETFFDPTQSLYVVRKSG